MSRRPAVITQADVDRAMKVAEKRGMTVRILPDGSIIIVPQLMAPDAPVDWKGDIRL